LLDSLLQEKCFSNIMKETMLIVISSVILILGDFSDALELNNCEKAIYNCCDEETHSPLSLRCFELNRCAGLYWSRQICTQKYIDRVNQKLLKRQTTTTTTTTKPPKKFMQSIDRIDNEIVDEPQKKSKFPVSEDIFVEINEIVDEPTGVTVKRPRNIQQSFKLDSKLTPLGISSVINVIRARPDIQCSRAIVNCCDTNSQIIPFRCFEREGCPGIYWSFRRPRKLCSQYIIDKANETLQSL